MQLRCDTHTHTIFSRHAYSTIEENVRAAREEGMELLSATDHFSAMLFPDYRDVRNYQYLFNMDMWPREWMGVALLRGCEADIVDLEGHLYGYDIPVRGKITGDPFDWGGERSLYEHVTRKMDYVIASVHGKAFAAEAGEAACTEMYLRVLDSPRVFILGHLGRSDLPICIDEILTAARAKHKLIEINEHSLKSEGRVFEKCRRILERCAELSVPISIGSDAHVSYAIGKFPKIRKMMEEIHFPEELVASRSKQTFLEALEASGVTDTSRLV